MTRLIVFVLVVCGLLSITLLDQYKSMPKTNKAFDYKGLKKEHDDKIKMLADIEAARLAALEPKVVVKKEKIIFKVELTTEGLKRGHKLYTKCIVCHGKVGEGKKSQDSPKIGGQYDWYLTSQITAMQSGVRVNKIMNPYIKKLSAQDIKDLSEYIAKFPW